MSNTTTDKRYKPSGGPEIETKVASTSDPYTVGSIMSLDSSGFAIPAAANANRVGLVTRSYVDVAGDTYVVLDVGGAIALSCVFSSATDVGTKVIIADNQTVSAIGSSLNLMGGVVARVVSANVADVKLAHMAALSGAA